MKCIFSVLCLLGFLQLLFAETQKPSDQFTDFSSLGRMEFSVPLHCYTDAWDPNEKLPVFLPGGIRVEEKDLIIGINEDAMRKAIERDDELRYQNSWLADYYRSLELREEDDDEEE
jgi:hypothetical protein